jgi:hypothetical protein
MHLPSAGMIRFRFDGFAFASQPVRAPRGMGKDRANRGGCKASGGAGREALELRRAGLEMLPPACDLVTDHD